MAIKMLRWERAWQHFTAAMLEGKFKQDNRPRTSRRRSSRLSEGHYWKLVALAKDLGITVTRGADLGTSHDATGNEFHVGGDWSPHLAKIRLDVRSLPVLGHEMGHAISYILVNSLPRAPSELTACGAGYLLVCHTSGISSPRANIAYAIRQGATAETFLETQNHILEVFKELLSGLNE